MTETIRFTPDESRPDRDAVLAHQGIPVGKQVNDGIESLCAAAIRRVAEVADPLGVLGEISTAEFERVYAGEGRNEPRTPVSELFPHADALALFAVTLGERITREIAERFRAHELAFGAMLDSAAAVAADKLAEQTTARFQERLTKAGRAAASSTVLHYSPGYCGWHLSGQRKLFDYLRPERIGITLRDSFLMDPLKSVSGVLIAGPRELHRFAMDYAFCPGCEERGCRARIRALFPPAPREHTPDN